MKKTHYNLPLLARQAVHGALFLVPCSLFILLGTACVDELDTEQNGVISTSSFYQTDSDCNEAITDVYSTFNWYNTNYSGTCWYMKTLLSDEVVTGGSSRSDVPEAVELNEYQYDYSNTCINAVFSTTYELINRANLVINNFDPDQSEIMCRNVAEAKVFRAMCNFELVTLWGTAPLVLEAVRDDYKSANSTADELWAQIEEDLTDAINSGALNEKTSIDDDTSGVRITKQFAQAMLGKAYVFQGKYSDAITPLQAVVNSGLYGFLDNYSNYCVAAYNNNREVMFSDNNVNDTSIGDYHQFFPWVFINIHVSYLTGQEVNGNDYSYMGYGILNPSQSLIDAFLENEPDSQRYNETINDYYDMLDLGISLIDGQEYYANCGYFNYKYRGAVSSRITGYSMSYYNNNVYMKYSEVVLLLAEALIQSQGAGAGDTYINMIRDKAGVEQLSGATLEDLKLEKRLELYMDGVRYQDLIRWGDAADVLAEQGKEIPAFLGLNDDGTFNVNTARYTNSSYGFKEKHKLLPFPQEEMEVNPNIVQNSGW